MLTNSQDYDFSCSLWMPNTNERVNVIVYLHGNTSNRLEGYFCSEIGCSIWTKLFPMVWVYALLTSMDVEMLKGSLYLLDFMRNSRSNR